MQGIPTQESTTQVIFAAEARKQLLEGIKVAAAAVGCTLGPKGKTVLIQQQGMAPVSTKDGVTVSKSIRLKHPVMRMGADLIREAASQTNEVAGDGTTTATVLTAALVESGMKLLTANYDAPALCHGIEAAARLVDDLLVSGARKVETSNEVAQVGTISANGDRQIGDLIAQAMEKVGRDGIITVEDAKGMTTSLAVAEGMQFDRGYLSPYFVTDQERMRAAYEASYVLVTDRKLGNLKELVPVLEAVVRAQKPLLIIADEVEGDAIQGLVLNRLKSGLQVVAIKAPGYGQHKQELLNDICVLTGAKLVSSATGLSVEKVQLSDLGQCKKFVVDAKTTTLVGTGATKDHVAKHAGELRKQLEDVTLAEEERTKLKVRVAKLASGVAVIRVGGATEVEMVERKYRIEDALNATRAATEEGIVPGGGHALVVCSQLVRAAANDSLKDGNLSYSEGFKVVADAIQAPYRRIVENSGANPQVVMTVRQQYLNNPIPTGADVNEGTFGYNAATGKYVDLLEAGVIDPVKVTRTALKNAVSVAITFLQLDAVVYDEVEDK